MMEGAVCQDGEESARNGPPWAVRQPKPRLLRPRCDSRFLDPACSAMIAARFGSHLGNVSLDAGPIQIRREQIAIRCEIRLIDIALCRCTISGFG
jgi:hypothetical protein